MYSKVCNQCENVMRLNFCLLSFFATRFFSNKQKITIVAFVQTVVRFVFYHSNKETLGPGVMAQVWNPSTRDEGGES